MTNKTNETVRFIVWKITTNNEKSCVLRVFLEQHYNKVQVCGGSSPTAVSNHTQHIHTNRFYRTEARSGGLRRRMQDAVWVDGLIPSCCGRFAAGI